MKKNRRKTKAQHFEMFVRPGKKKCSLFPAETEKSKHFASKRKQKTTHQRRENRSQTTVERAELRLQRCVGVWIGGKAGGD